MSQTIKNLIDENIDILLFDEVDSTNNVCKKIGNQGFKNTLVISKSQTGGRGRLGRNFISNNNKGIYMSLLIRPNINISDISKVTCVVGTSILKILKKYIKNSIYIKWVNDIYINDKKICGILTESSLVENRINYIVIGIGINLYHQVFPADIIASSIEDETGIVIDKDTLIGEIINQVLIDIRNINSLEHVEIFRKHMYLLNEYTLLKVRDNEFIGKIIGINDSFELITDVDKRIITISSGEILKVSKIKEDWNESNYN